jgi:hypothetical protein
MSASRFAGARILAAACFIPSVVSSEQCLIVVCDRESNAQADQKNALIPPRNRPHNLPQLLHNVLIIHAL